MLGVVVRDGAEETKDYATCGGGSLQGPLQEGAVRSLNPVSCFSRGNMVTL